MTTNLPVPADRTKFIGGSDIAAILGVSPWRSRVALWEDKIKPRAEGPAKAVLTRGKRWESVVAEMLAEELQSQGHSVEIIASNKRYIDQAFSMFACEIDFEVKLDGADEITNVELKTVHPFKSKEWGDSGTDSAPIWYVAQAQWGLGVTSRKNVIIAPLFGADEIKVFPLERDDVTITAMRQRAAQFWSDYVMTGTPPPPAIISDLDILHPKESEAGALLADDELTAKILRMRAIDREIKARTAEMEAIEFDVKRAMRDSAELVVNGDTVAATWKARPHTYLDQGALKEAHPKIHKEFTRKAESRVFTLKTFAWE